MIMMVKLMTHDDDGKMMTHDVDGEDEDMMRTAMMMTIMGMVMVIINDGDDIMVIKDDSH